MLLSRLGVLLLLAASVSLLAQPGQPMEEEADPKSPKLRTDLPPVPILESGEPADPPERPINLAEEAKLETDKALKQLLADFSFPHDIIRIGGKPLPITPLPRRSDRTKPFTVDVELLNADGSVDRRRKYMREQFESISHYEINAIESVGQLLQEGKGANRLRQLVVAEMIAHEVLRFHTKALADKARTGEGWEKIEEELKRLLLRARIAQLDTLTAAKQFVEAGPLYRRLKRLYPTDREVAQAVFRCFTAEAADAVARQQYVRARLVLENFARRYGREESDESRRIEGILQDRAGELVRQAEKLAAQADHAAALFTLERAQDIWPRHVGMRELLRQARLRHPILRIGVKQLPQNLWPTTAQSDVDRMASHLLFESLLQLRAGPSVQEGYAVKIGSPPRWDNGELHIVLPEGISWAEASGKPKPLTAEDVRRSLELLGDPRCFYYEPLAGERERLLGVLVDGPNRLRVQFTRSQVDPHIWLTFPLLPAERYLSGRSPRNPAGQPAGTGPYVLSRSSVDEVVFTANPAYRRSHAPDGPHIKEIRFVRYASFEQAKDALHGNRLQLLVDLTSREAVALGSGPFDMITPTQQGDPRSAVLTNSRVYFLAPNHRRKPLQNEELRRAIGFALDREAVLTQVYRAGGKRFHQVLNGPYPLGSWAYDPDFAPAKRNPHDPKQAAELFEQARAKLGALPALTLRYAAEDEQAGVACRLFAGQLAGYGLPLRVVATPAAQLADELRKADPDFDLVYAHYDFPNEMLSLWPLFEPPLGDGLGRNFMGYAGDVVLESAFRAMHDRRDLSAVQRHARDIHGRIVTRGVLLPLWQLDRHVAVHHSLRFKRLHPLWVFEDVEEWELRPE